MFHLHPLVDFVPQMSWSYSKYMATLKKQELQLNKNKKANKKALLETSISTVSGTHTHTHTWDFVHRH